MAFPIRFYTHHQIILRLNLGLTRSSLTDKRFIHVSKLYVNLYGNLYGLTVQVISSLRTSSPFLESGKKLDSLGEAVPSLNFAQNLVKNQLSSDSRFRIQSVRALTILWCMAGIDPDHRRLRPRSLPHFVMVVPSAPRCGSRFASRNCPFTTPVGGRSLRARRFTPMTFFPDLFCCTYEFSFQSAERGSVPRA